MSNNEKSRIPERSDDIRKKFVLEAIFERRKTDPKCGWLGRLENCNFGSFDTYSGIVADYALTQLAEQTAKVDRLNKQVEILSSTLGRYDQTRANIGSEFDVTNTTIAAQKERIAELTAIKSQHCPDCGYLAGERKLDGESK